MTKWNAFGFFSFGLLMWLLPTLAPQLFPPNAIDGSSTRALWVQLMALVQGSLGVTFLLRDSALSAVARWLATKSAPPPLWRNAPVPSGAVPVAINRSTPAAAWSEQRALLAGRRFQPHRLIAFRG